MAVSTSATKLRITSDHYGYRYPYSGRGESLEKIADIPTLMAAIALGKFDQLIINKYLQGQRIAPHIDHIGMFGNTISCITIDSGRTIAFSHD